jgi:Isochorismatase family
VMCGLYTSVCLAYPAIDALRDGFEVMFLEDAVADMSKEEHDVAVLRLIQAGAIPNLSVAMMSEWFRDWALPQADIVRAIYPEYLRQVAALKGKPPMLSPKSGKHAAAAAR